MINFFDKLIKKITVNQKVIILDKNDNGKITMKFDIFYDLLNYILIDYPIFDEAEIEFDEINKKENLYRLFIITKNSLKNLSDNKLKIIKKKIMSSFQENGFNLINVVITSEESLKE